MCDGDLKIANERRHVHKRWRFFMEHGDDDMNIIKKIGKEWFLDDGTPKLGLFDDFSLQFLLSFLKNCANRAADID